MTKSKDHFFRALMYCFTACVEILVFAFRLTFSFIVAAGLQTLS